MSIEEYLKRKYSSFSNSVPSFGFDYVIDETHIHEIIVRKAFREMHGLETCPRLLTKSEFIGICVALLQEV